MNQIPVDDGSQEDITPDEWVRARTAHAEHVKLALSSAAGRAAFAKRKGQ